MVIELDIIQTLAVAVVVLFIGRFVKKYVKCLERLCIPDPVVGGIIFSLLMLAGYSSGVCVLELDTTLQNVFMTVFFTAVGFTCDLKVLKKYGKRGIQFTIIVFLLVIFQNIIGVGYAKLFGLHPLLGLCTGSAAMTGGHGTAGSFAPLFEELYGCDGAMTVGMAAATFGLVSGGLIGGPVGNILVKKHRLEAVASARKGEQSSVAAETKQEAPLSAENMFHATNQIVISMGIGTIIYILLKMVGITFPSYVGGMLMGVVLRNISAYTGKFETPLAEIDCIGNISLTIFVSMALMSLKLWQLASLALPMIVTLATQVAFIALFMVFAGYYILGRDYDAAVMVTGCCGFGLGAMPNGVSNMQAFTKRWGPSDTAFFVVPGVGSVIIDVVNGLLLTTFMNFLA
ncbi:sodium/glutamate symporter [uncultured Clostridium sp.]|uniref:sodium/glutamate symporter n=1 Tax=uncultured Clostridium sp. TaxID=59620 RepID=UPI0025E165FB|nr:sodium/glutamate symporter [uncultured Clostridium sp.]